MNISDELEKLKETLLQQRDELKVKASLAKLEARDEWEKIEEKVDQFLAKIEVIGSEAVEASEGVAKSARQLGEEIKTAYERIKAHL